MNASSSVLQYIELSISNPNLGIPLCERHENDPDTLALGTTMVASNLHSSTPGDTTFYGGGLLRPFDALVAIQNEYVAFRTFESIQRKLQSASRPFTVVFARPASREAWSSVVYGEAEIMRGELERFDQGYLYTKRWLLRDVTLKRDSLVYHGRLELKSYGIDGVSLLAAATAATPGLSPEDVPRSFLLCTNEKGELLFRAPSTKARIFWMHAIECAQYRAWRPESEAARALRAPAKSGGGTPVRSKASLATPSPSSEGLESGNRERLLAYEEELNASSFRATGPYALLAPCFLRVHEPTEAPLPDQSLPPPPAGAVLQAPPYDFALELSVVKRSAAAAGSSTDEDRQKM